MKINPTLSLRRQFVNGKGVQKLVMTQLQAPLLDGKNRSQHRSRQKAAPTIIFENSISTP
jgi:hypothetical protein